ncbi:TRAP transporter small permease [Tepidanaerobacter sp. EBM-38]|uniref:TRAP transporter small permease n=1 Tax=Tepidanaerobacter sp. EBM-38 TaxID=1918496 RepID=UPI000AA897E3|nr:TRAP transporter small permease [Tepidanaerobacter sp. EBM-38]
MIERIESVLKKIDVIFEWMIVLILGGMTLSIFFQVIFRYVFKSPVAWTEELARFLFIWMTFIASYTGARKGSHIGVEALQKALPRIGGKILKILSNLINTAFFSVIVHYTILFWPKLMIQISPALGLPMAFVYLCMIIGPAFMAFWYFILAIKELTEVSEQKQVEEDMQCNC